MPSGSSSSFAAEARRQAAQILSRAPYAHKAGAALPLAGVLRAIGHGFLRLVGPPAHWLAQHVLVSLFRGIHARLGAGGWVVVLALAVGAGIVVGVLLIRRRARIGPRLVGTPPAAISENMADLERAAEEAEAKGENELAVRLRFRSGLARLEAQGVIPDRLAMTSQQLGRILQSQLFDELASQHEFIAYAHAPASAGDAASARDRWRHLLDEAPRSGLSLHTARYPAGSTQ